MNTNTNQRWKYQRLGKKQPKFRKIYISNTWPEIEIFVMTSAARHHVIVWSEMQSTKKKFLSGVVILEKDKTYSVTEATPTRDLSLPVDRSTIPSYHIELYTLESLWSAQNALN